MSAQKGSLMLRSLAALLLLSAAVGCSTTNGDPTSAEPEITDAKKPDKKGSTTDPDGEQTNSTCTAKTCTDLGVTCGSHDDGCGGKAECGTCDPSCKAKTCAELKKTCGKHDDGCGSLADCGACDPSCKPKTCAELQKTCGNHDDGCGGTVSCGVCQTACAADAQESNNTPQTAKDLGPTSDSGTTKALYSLTLPDGDEDWFKTKVSDDGFSGNPRVSASVARQVEVSVFYVCDSATNYSFCPNAADTADNTIGHGCRGRSNAMVQSSCSGIDESGTAYIRVRKLANDGQCGGYALDLKVETE